MPNGLRPPGLKEHKTESYVPSIEGEIKAGKVYKCKEHDFGKFIFRVDSAHIIPSSSLLVHYSLCISVYYILQFLANNEIWGQALKCSTADNLNTPLHAAARQGNHLAVKVMLGEGFDARTKNEHSQSPMHLAAKEGHYM